MGSIGTFTQEDPIGLAGGLNLYGFANGDPVNFSDPFGLCPPADNNISDCPADHKFIYPMQIRTRPLERVLTGVGEVSGLNSVGRGVDRIIRGEAGGALELAMAIPLVPGERVVLSGGERDFAGREGSWDRKARVGE